MAEETFKDRFMQPLMPQKLQTKKWLKSLKTMISGGAKQN